MRNGKRNAQRGCWKLLRNFLLRFVTFVAYGHIWVLFKEKIREVLNCPQCAKFYNIIMFLGFFYRSIFVILLGKRQKLIDQLISISVIPCDLTITCQFLLIYYMDYWVKEPCRQPSKLIWRKWLIYPKYLDKRIPKLLTFYKKKT